MTVSERPRGPRIEPPRPAGYQLLRQERIPMTRVSWASIVSAPFWLAVFVGVAAALGEPAPRSITFTVVNILIGAAILLLVGPVVHEAVHGVVAWALGAHPTYGIGPGYAYTTFREPVGGRQYLVIGLAPLVVLSLACLVLMVTTPLYGFALIFAVTNASGAAGDIWVARRTRGLPAEARVYDLADGFAVFVPEQAALP